MFSNAFFISFVEFFSSKNSVRLFFYNFYLFDKVLLLFINFILEFIELPF